MTADEIDALIGRLTERHDVEIADAEQHVTIRQQAPLLADLAGTLAASVAIGRGAQKALHERLKLNVDAVDLHRSIEHRVRQWAAQTRYRPPAGWPPLDRLLAIWWRRVQLISPIDVGTYAPTLLEWVEAIEDLIDPPHRRSLRAPCPECGVAYVETAEEHGRALQVVVRQPAERSVVTCRSCGQTWRGLDAAKALAALIYPEEKTA